MSLKIPLWTVVLGLAGSVIDDLLFGEALWFMTIGAIVGYLMWVGARASAIKSGADVHIGSTIFVGFVTLCVTGILVQVWRENPVDAEVLTHPVAWLISVPVSLIVSAREWSEAADAASARPPV